MSSNAPRPLAGSAVTLSYATVLVVAVVVLQRPLGAALAVAVAAGLALLLLPVHAGVRAWVDRRTTGRARPYAEPLARAGLRLAQATSLTQAARLLEGALVDALPVTRACFYVLESRLGQCGQLRRVGLVEAGSHSTESMPETCDVDRFPAVAEAVKQVDPLTRADVAGEGGAAFWDRHGLELLIPAALGDQDEPHVRGLIALGARRVGDGYDERDRELLLDLARHFAVAIANAAVIDRIREDRDGLFQQTGALSSALTNLRDVQQQVLEAEKRAIEEEKQAALGRLAAGIVHEINTPLGTIASSIDTLGRAVKRYRPYVARRAGADGDDGQGQGGRAREGEGEGGRAGADGDDGQGQGGRAREREAADEAAIKALRAIDAQSQPLEVLAASKQRISSVIDSLKRFVGLDAAEVKPLDICESIADAITLITGTVGERVRISTRFPDERPVVLCRAAKLNQVFLNLIENAAKAIEGPGAIDIEVTRQAGQVRVEIRDSGRGMDQKRVEQVLDFGFTMKTDRVGLRTGLPASKMAIQQLGGTLTVSSAPGQGTGVMIELPCKARGG